MAVETLTFGCRLNAYESEIIKAEAEKAGLSNAIVVNTCAVTAEAVRQAKQAIRKARRDNPERAIIVTGCAAQTEARTFGDMAEVDLVIGNADKLRAESYAPIAFGIPLNDKVQVNDVMAVRETAGHLIEGMDGRARAFVQVQNGCDHRCTFCIIPFGRGPSRSVPMGAVVEQVRRLVDNGYAEVVLTGVDITSYGGDLPGTPTLGRLVQAILRYVPDLPRLRISSIDSIEADAALYEAVGSERRLMPHLHLSLQSGDDLILKRMKRRHSGGEALGVVAKLRALRPDMVFGADIIAGFPTEDEAMFDNTLSFVSEAALTYLHVFPYSPRPGTPAARMPQVDRGVARERAARLRALGEERVAAYAQSRVGRVESVLVESDGLGRTEHFLPVKIQPSDPGSSPALGRAVAGGFHASPLEPMAPSSGAARQLLPRGEKRVPLHGRATDSPSPLVGEGARRADEGAFSAPRGKGANPTARQRAAIAGEIVEVLVTGAAGTALVGEAVAAARPAA